MIESIQSIRKMGVYDSYDKPSNLKNFSDRNVIYGWNYSGKTTLSRLFAMLEDKRVSDEFPDVNFSISCSGEARITPENLETLNLQIRVFNSDYVDKNIKWDGKGFNPIFLLGKESQESQKKIEWYERVSRRCQAISSDLSRKIDDDLKLLASAKTEAAKNIKNTLGILDAFNSTHLDKLLLLISSGEDCVSLSGDELTSALKLISSSVDDKLPPIAVLNIDLKINLLLERLNILLAKKPSSHESIDKLSNAPELNEWVWAGLRIHAEKDICEFCEGKFTESRRSVLMAHYSQEVLQHKGELKSGLHELEGSKVNLFEIRENDLYPQFRALFSAEWSLLREATSKFNAWIERASSLVGNKFDNQFIDCEKLSYPKELIESVETAKIRVNDLIAKHNHLAENFELSRVQALQSLKLHFANQFFIEQAIKSRKKFQDDGGLRLEKFKLLISQAGAKIRTFQAEIDRAQNGRSRINERISTILGGNAIQISVDGVQGNQTFRLTRQGKIVRRLSEGEKTAIAFAYFLTSLEVHEKLEEVIVFIDDPISSLDSNHVFQIFSIIKTMFFKWQEIGNGKSEWVTTCKQFFISTHNFEFFNFLKDLKGKQKYPLNLYMTKRVNPLESTLTNLPASIEKHNSEYHYLFEVLYNFSQNENFEGDENLLAIPNAARRFLELYTYLRYPSEDKNIERRAALLFDKEAALRIVKLLHHFSHLESVERLVNNSDLISDINLVVKDIFSYMVKNDQLHYRALTEARA